MRFLFRSLSGLFLLALTVGLIAVGVGQIRDAARDMANAPERSFPARERVFAVNVVRVQPETIAPTLEAFGEVRSRRSLDVRPEVQGAVVMLSDNFIDGGRVSAGEVLFQVDPANAQSDLALARAELAEAQAEAAEAQRSLTLSQDELTAAQETVTLQERALARQQDLVNRGVGTAAALESAELTVNSARQSVLSERLSVQQAEQRVTTTAARIERARINASEAERALRNATLTASFDGILSNVTIVQGGVVGQNERVATLIDDTSLEVAVRVSTEQYSRLIDENGLLRPADVVATLDVFGSDLVAQGTLSRVSASVGEGQTGRLLFVSLDAAPGFRPGDFVSVAIAEPEVRGVARLPASALSSARTVLALDDENRLVEVAVDLVRRQGDDVLVRAFEIAGQNVVSERSPLLGAGIRVNPITPEAVAEQMAAAPAMVELDDDRRAKLIAFIEGNTRMPAAAKQRVISQLQEPAVPAAVVERIEGRMGG
ncbi:MAG: HlyD family efflux transporter periplasmic adaptor subunit [Pseudomonadota bacterium]